MFRRTAPLQVLAEDDMLDEERQAVAAARPETNLWMGVALSGGGIRSATFCLGVLQRLAKASLLAHFDYMSSVSGGGYTGASLQWWWLREPDLDANAHFPYGTKLNSALSSEDPKLSFLRWHANYLAPGGGISIWSALAVLLRTLAISLFVWLPPVIFAFIFLRVFPKWTLYRIGIPFELHFGFGPVNVLVPLFALAACAGVVVIILTFFVATALLVAVSILVPAETTDNRSQRIRRASRCAIVGIVFCIVSYSVLRQFENFDFPGLSWSDEGVFVILYTSLIFGGVALAVAFLQWLNLLEFGVSYSLRRAFDLYGTSSFEFLAGFAVVASLPFAAALISHYVEGQIAKGALLAIFTGLSGVFSGLYGHFVQAQRLSPKFAISWAATIGGGLFLYSFALVCYFGASLLIEHHAWMPPLAQQYSQAAFVAILFFSVLFGLFGNPNYLGLHRFYRDRLMEAFMPSDTAKAAGLPHYSEADRFPLADFWPPRARADRPYPLINTNAILINDDDPVVALRGGASFILSPLFVGSSNTCWARTREHGERHGPLTLASAMAASGAAANANAAYLGSGITRERLISIVMMLLNARLGLWVGAPGARSWAANYWMPGFAYGILRGGYRSNSKFMELTDGGHYENLGAYELIRRRLDIIMVLDSEEDPDTSMFALASLCQRSLEDFGVRIEIGEKADKMAPAGDMGYPTRATFTEKSFFVVSISYPAIIKEGVVKKTAKTGFFVYIKSNMIRGLSFPARGYKAKNPEFPNQSTMDQFFEPAQFEAYRDLGYSSANAFIEALKIDGAVKDDMFKKIASFV